MLYLLMSPLGWLAFIVLLIVVVVLYTKINRQIEQLRHDMTALQAELEQLADSVNTAKPSHAAYINPIQDSSSESVEPLTQSAAESATSAVLIPDATENKRLEAKPPTLPSPPQSKIPQNTTATIEPDERSLPIVTSIIHSMQNWFFGGNLVVRVGVLVLLVGVVLLLRLLSDYIEIPITAKLISIGIIGLGLAALGLKLAKNRFAYGITLQGAGLAIAYLTTFFAYSAYHVLSSVPSFIGLGILSAITIGLAVRQNALPLALLALSGGFFAPILTSAKSRSIWLGINLCTALLAAAVIGQFEAVLAKVVALAILMPVVASMGGIAGSQTLTVVIRGMAMGQIGGSNRLWLLNKELWVGAINGIIWAIIMAFIAQLWFHDIKISAVIGLAIAINMTAANVSGISIPLMLKRMNIDPALSASVILTTVTDIVGFMSFLGLASVLIL